jgi:hypothetical protein
MQVYDPSVFTKILDMRAARISSMVAAPPQDVGIYTEGNPPSADAVEFQEGRRNRRARLQQKIRSPAVVEVVQMMLKFQNKGDLPPEFARMEADWIDLDETPLSVVAPALQLLISEGAIPATSDVTLRKAGFSAVERRRLAEDREARGRQGDRPAARGDRDTGALSRGTGQWHPGLTTPVVQEHYAAQIGLSAAIVKASSRLGSPGPHPTGRVACPEFSHRRRSRCPRTTTADARDRAAPALPSSPVIAPWTAESCRPTSTRR